MAASGSIVTGRTLFPIIAWAAIMGACIVTLGLVVATSGTPVPDSWGFRGASSAFGLTCGTVGAIVAFRRPENLIGWLFLAIGAIFALQGLVDEYVLASVFVVPGGLPWTTQLGWLLTWIWVPPLGMALIFLPLLFPDGHLLSPHWKASAVLGAVAIAAFSLAMAIAPGPIQQATFMDNPLVIPGLDPETYLDLAFGSAIILLVGAIGLAVTSLVRRFRSASDDTRRQIKWFALATLIAGAVNSLYQPIPAIGASPTVVKTMELLVILSLLALPAAAGLAILRYRLYDIDRIISRTIAYGLISALLVAIFLSVNLGLQSVLSSLTSNNSLAVAASTLLVAALFTPVRRRVQDRVDGRFDRARYDGERTAEAFADRMRAAIDLSALASDLDGTVRAAVAPSRVDLWLRETGR